jgi:hypothetical protein
VHRSVGTRSLNQPRWRQSLTALAALILGVLICSEDADARLSGGLSFAGASTSFVVDSLVDLDNSPLPVAAQPTYPGGSLVGLFSRPGLIGGFAAGFLGSGLVGLLFGHGVVGELSGVESALGLLFQLALIAMLGRLIWTWWHDKKADGLADLSPRQLADAYGRPRHEAPPMVDPGTDVASNVGEPESGDLSKPRQPHC